MQISTAHSGLRAFVSLPMIQERQKKGRKIGRGGTTDTEESGRGERGLGFQWVDWRGFGPLNRSTCSSGISRKQSSILVQWGCLPITPWVLMGAWLWSRFLVLSFGVVVCEDSLSGLTPGYCWCRCLDQLGEALSRLSKCHWYAPRVKTLADHWLTAELLVSSQMQLFT